MPRAIHPQPLTETDFDVVIVGTDLPHAILAAALSIAGSRVLHLDSNEFYGGTWATTQLSVLESAIQDAEQGRQEIIIPSKLETPEESTIGNHFPDFELQPLLRLSLFDQLFPLGARRLQSMRAVERYSSIKSCLLDLVPRPIMSAGNMIELLVRTNVGHYVDFRAIDALYVQFPGSTGLQRVPGSRADVFQNSFITMPEKRLMMRYVTRSYETIVARKEEIFEGNESFVENDEDSGMSLQEDMDTMRLTPKLQTFLTHSIIFSIGDKQLSKKDGMNRVYDYQTSVMRFGTKTPFLYPNFGTGELSQAFCRLCAVHGGTYVLRRGVTGLITPNKGQNESSSEASEYQLGIITTADDIVRAKYIFMPGALMRQGRENGENVVDVWRAVAVLDGSVLKAAQPERAMITVPRGTVGNDASAVRLRQLDSTVMVCPEGIFILYAETIEEGGTEEDLIKVLENYMVIGVNGEGNQRSETEQKDQLHTNQNETDSKADIKPNCLWGISYARPHVRSENVSEHVVLTSKNEREHDAGNAVLEAQRCFEIVHPEGEFLPRRNDEDGHMSNGSAYPNKTSSDTEEQGDT